MKWHNLFIEKSFRKTPNVSFASCWYRLIGKQQHGKAQIRFAYRELLTLKISTKRAGKSGKHENFLVEQHNKQIGRENSSKYEIFIIYLFILSLHQLCRFLQSQIHI